MPPVLALSLAHSRSTCAGLYSPCLPCISPLGRSVTHSANKRLLMGQAVTVLSRSLHQGAPYACTPQPISGVQKQHTSLAFSNNTHDLALVSRNGDQECSHVECVGCAAHNAWLRFSSTLHCIIEYASLTLHDIMLLVGRDRLEQLCSCDMESEALTAAWMKWAASYSTSAPAPLR